MGANGCGNQDDKWKVHQRFQRTALLINAWKKIKNQQCGNLDQSGFKPVRKWASMTWHPWKHIKEQSSMFLSLRRCQSSRIYHNKRLKNTLKGPEIAWDSPWFSLNISMDAKAALTLSTSVRRQIYGSTHVRFHDDDIPEALPYLL